MKEINIVTNILSFLSHQIQSKVMRTLITCLVASVAMVQVAGLANAAAMPEDDLSSELRYRKRYRTAASRDLSMINPRSPFPQNSDFFITQILNDNRRRTSTILKGASNILSTVADEILRNENLDRGQNFVTTFANAPSSNGLGVSRFDVQNTSGNFHSFPILIVGDAPSRSDQSINPLNTVAQQSTFEMPQNPSYQGSFSQAQFPLTQSNIFMDHTNEGKVIIPVASGGVEPPRNYNPHDRVTILNDIPFIFPQNPSYQGSTSQAQFPLTQSNIFMDHTNEGQLIIPVASGGVEPPRNYNPNDRVTILNDIPWISVINQQPGNGNPIFPNIGNGYQQSGNGNPIFQGSGSQLFPGTPNIIIPEPANPITSGSANTKTPGPVNPIIQGPIIQHPASQIQPNSPPGNTNFVFSAINGIQQFTLDIITTFNRISGNIVYSPVSISSLLSLLTLASKGETRFEIESVLHLPNTESSLSQHIQYENILKRLNHVSPGVTIRASSRLFVEETIPTFDVFTEKAVQHYNCTVSVESFRRSPIKTQNNVNKWVENETEGKIKNFIEKPFSPNTLFVAVNTVYFNGEWKTPFHEPFTNIAEFDTGTKVIRIPMMTNVLTTPHYFSKKLNVDIAALPYYGDEYAMFIILPRESPKQRTIESVEYQLDPFIIDELIFNMTPKMISLNLPKMRMAMKVSLKHSLSQLKIEHMFSPTLADFSGLSNARPLWVSEVLHEAVIEVNEAGTVAVAGSGTAIDRIGPLDRVNVNKPAIIFIRDLITGTPLFWTRLVEPKPITQT